jgi:hypothetical protein
MLVMLDETEASEDTLRSLGIFSFTADVSLGGELKVRRGQMTRSQLAGRRLIIESQGDHDEAPVAELAWIAEAFSAMEGYPPETLVEHVVDARGRRLDPGRLRAEARALERQADAIEKLRRSSSI